MPTYPQDFVYWSDFTPIQHYFPSNHFFHFYAWECTGLDVLIRFYSIQHYFPSFQLCLNDASQLDFMLILVNFTLLLWYWVVSAIAGWLVWFIAICTLLPKCNLCLVTFNFGYPNSRLVFCSIVLPFVCSCPNAISITVKCLITPYLDGHFTLTWLYSSVDPDLVFREWRHFVLIRPVK